MSQITLCEKGTTEWIINEYINKKRTLKDISLELNCSVGKLKMFLKANNIRKSKKKTAFYFRFTREQLYDLYIEQKLSAVSIGKILNVSKSAIHGLLVYFNIPRRNRGYFSLKSLEARDQRKKNYKGISGSYWAIIKRCGRHKNREFTITQEIIWEIWKKQNGKCALSGVSIFLPQTCKELCSKTASLDRIDSSKGYVPNNVQWIHKDLQMVKWDMQEAQLFYWCQKIVDFQKSKKCL